MWMHRADIREGQGVGTVHFARSLIRLTMGGKGHIFLSTYSIVYVRKCSQFNNITTAKIDLSGPCPDPA